MFGDAPFASLTFSDFFYVPGVSVSYIFRKSRTKVIAIVPDDGKLLTNLNYKIIRTSVAAVTPDESQVVTDVQNDRKLRTSVSSTNTTRSTNPQTGL